MKCSNGSLTFSVVIIWIVLLFNTWCIRCKTDELQERIKKLEATRQEK